LQINWEAPISFGDANLFWRRHLSIASIGDFGEYSYLQQPIKDNRWKLPKKRNQLLVVSAHMHHDSQAHNG
jgi:hypothetical protein